MTIMAFDEFSEKVLGIKLTAFQKRLYQSLQKNDGKLRILHLTRREGMNTLRKCMKEYKEYKVKETK